MKKLVLSLIVALAAASTGLASARSAPEFSELGSADKGSSLRGAPLPRQFAAQPVASQYRICGELLSGLAMEGAKVYTEDQDPKKLEIILSTATQAVLFLGATPNMDAAAKRSARTLSREIEGLGADEHMAVAMTCVQGAKGWLAEGKVSQEELKTATEQAGALLLATGVFRAAQGAPEGEAR